MENYERVLSNQIQKRRRWHANHTACTSEDTKIVVVSKDTDVLILLVYAYAKYKPTKEWYMKIDANKFASIKSIAEYLGSNISVCLPQMHALTGSDTASYLFNNSKTKVLKGVQENMKSLLYIKN